MIMVFSEASIIKLVKKYSMGHVVIRLTMRVWRYDVTLDMVSWVQLNQSPRKSSWRSQWWMDVSVWWCWDQPVELGAAWSLIFQFCGSNLILIRYWSPQSPIMVAMRVSQSSRIINNSWQILQVTHSVFIMQLQYYASASFSGILYIKDYLSAWE